MWFEPMKTLYWPLAFFLLAGIATVLWLPDRNAPAETAGNTGVELLAADYDYYIQNMQTTRFGADGQAVSQLRAERVTHYPDGDRAELQAPGFTALGTVSDAWQVSAATGTLVPDAESAGERLELQGRVVLNKALARGDFLEVRTTALTVYPDAEEAVTAAPVSLQTRDTRLESTGMRVLLATDYIKLNEGRGTHDPAPIQ